MNTTEIILILFLLVLSIASVLGQAAAYHNGVTDGFGFAREPKNPGYAKAGRYLKKYMVHRWRELRDK